MKRHSVNKRRGAHAFKKSVSRTHGKNVAQAPMRGGWRL
ncbi:MAG: hypothetical protein [Microvirus sp.]|nr:MAG: hypothetical protein [Microvirus sp.]WNK14397.1 MAG: hypothetical protein [Microvirus sp.]